MEETPDTDIDEVTTTEPKKNTPKKSPTRRWWPPNLSTGDGLALGSILIGLVFAYTQNKSSNDAARLQVVASNDAAQLNADASNKAAQLQAVAAKEASELEARTIASTAKLQQLSSDSLAEMQNRQVFVGMAIGILGREAPEDSEGEKKLFPSEIQIMRDWAIRVINYGAEEQLKIPNDAIPSLISGKSSIQFGGSKYGYFGVYDYNSTYDFGGGDGFDMSAPRPSPPSDQPTPESE